jgi:hypothetical protein
LKNPQARHRVADNDVVSDMSIAPIDWIDGEIESWRLTVLLDAAIRPSSPS